MNLIKLEKLKLKNIIVINKIISQKERIEQKKITQQQKEIEKLR
jgi:hypothetical protein